MAVWAALRIAMPVWSEEKRGGYLGKTYVDLQGVKNTPALTFFEQEGENGEGEEELC